VKTLEEMERHAHEIALEAYRMSNKHIIENIDHLRFASHFLSDSKKYTRELYRIFSTDAMRTNNEWNIFYHSFDTVLNGRGLVGGIYMDPDYAFGSLVTQVIHCLDLIMLVNEEPIKSEEHGTSISKEKFLPTRKFEKYEEYSKNIDSDKPPYELTDLDKKIRDHQRRVYGRHNPDPDVINLTKKLRDIRNAFAHGLVFTKNMTSEKLTIQYFSANTKGKLSEFEITKETLLEIRALFLNIFMRFFLAQITYWMILTEEYFGEEKGEEYLFKIVNAYG